MTTHPYTKPRLGLRCTVCGAVEAEHRPVAAASPFVKRALAGTLKAKVLA